MYSVNWQQIIILGALLFNDVGGQLRDCNNFIGYKIMIDLGANCGNSYKKITAIYQRFDRSYLWEINPLLFHHLSNLSAANPDVVVVPYGAWHTNTQIKLDLIGDDRPQCLLSYWSGTSIAENELNLHHEKYFKSVTAHTMDFANWYKQHICEQDEVTLKVDIERAEYAVLSKMLAYGILCHPRRLLLEWHRPRQPLWRPQHFKVHINHPECFGYISTLEYVLQFCDREPEFVTWG
eukprot:TRINITY_DN6394_c0_g2_i2.p1 TRINITY_DN6394_c0_g2~~TRINITY_DN6394_c0_g2_i2.p1  ORF type:complete len:254 (-),score=26.41 TRINITY_DN6394_c0_g2_i2:205-912(-)